MDSSPTKPQTMTGTLLLVVLYVAILDGVSLSRIGISREYHARHPTRSIGRYYHRLPRSRLRRQAETAVIESLHIVSRITSRFSETIVTSVVRNSYSYTTEAKFNLEIPEKAFISNFTMIIDGTLIVTQVKSKEEADEVYEQAKKENKTAGKVDSSERTVSDPPQPGMERFTIAIAVRAESSVEFELTYLQLLERINGKYSQIISLRPQQIVADFSMQVYVYDVQQVKDLKVKEPSDKLRISHVYIVQDYLQRVTFTPTEEQQSLMNRTHGVNGELIVSYDVVHSDDGGLLETENGYFAHHFSPRDDAYDSLPKHIVFIIDISGSMSGRKIEQTRTAFITIIDQLAENDRFLMLLFSDYLEYWPAHNEPVQATAENKEVAKRFAERSIHADGGTNIAKAVKSGCDILRRQENPKGSNLIMFLTDGSPTVGETNPERIVSLVSDAAAGQVAIFSLAFGKYLDFELLEKLAYRTGGKVKRIHEEIDAVSQLLEFYYTISTPLLYDIKIEYPSNLVRADSVTQTQFEQYFQGSEIVVVGQLQDNVGDDLSFEATVTGEAKKNSSTLTDVTLSTNVTDVELPSEVANQTGFIERLYAYLRIKHLLKEILLTDDESKKTGLEEDALELALEYRLVTPLTSMIIVQPDNNTNKLTGGDSDEYDKIFASSVSPQKQISTASRTESLFLLIVYLVCSQFYL